MGWGLSCYILAFYAFRRYFSSNSAGERKEEGNTTMTERRHFTKRWFSVWHRRYHYHISKSAEKYFSDIRGLILRNTKGKKKSWVGFGLREAFWLLAKRNQKSLF